MASRVLLLTLLALAFSQVIASDPSPLQDFCVADKNSPGIYVYILFFLLLFLSFLVIDFSMVNYLITGFAFFIFFPQCL